MAWRVPEVFAATAMTLGFTYMGTKRQIAGQVAEVISQAPSGPLLDVFAGMSSVGKAVAPERPVWCNDIQYFAYNVARSYFTARHPPKLSPEAIRECQDFFETSRKFLSRSFASALSRESRAYKSANLNSAFSGKRRCCMSPNLDCSDARGNLEDSKTK